jgi:hypothetical protein
MVSVLLKHRQPIFSRLSEADETPTKGTLSWVLTRDSGQSKPRLGRVGNQVPLTAMISPPLPHIAEPIQG